MIDIELIILIFIEVIIFGIMIIGTILYIKYKIAAKKLSLSFLKFGDLGIKNCAINTQDSTCKNLYSTIIPIDLTILSLTTFNKNIILSTIQLISEFLVYINSKKIKDLTQTTTPNFIYSSIDSNPIALIYSNNNTTFIIFRGTQTINDIISDLSYNYYNTDSLPSKYKNTDGLPSKVSIHKKYNSIYLEIKEKILNFIKTNNVFICGHSMGAALVFILAEDLSKDSTKSVYVIGIAPPRIGNEEFVKNLKKNCKYVLSVINLADTVPSLFWSYMPNAIEPYTPPQFVLVTPCLLFYNLAPSIAACHQPITYYNGIKNNKLSFL
jgi:hypothetical protein